ncbi:MAG: co-chaperone GroES [Rhizomicrobium sp.]
MHDRVVVRRIEADRKTAGGIFIPDTAQEKTEEVEVVSVGPGARNNRRELVATDPILNKLPRDSTIVPERHFAFPQEVIDDPSLSMGEKRSILCEWASDACAVPSFPTLRMLPGTTFPVTFSAVMDALTQLDRKSYIQDEALASRGASTILTMPGRDRASPLRTATAHHLQA